MSDLRRKRFGKLRPKYLDSLLTGKRFGKLRSVNYGCEGKD